MVALPRRSRARAARARGCLPASTACSRMAGPRRSSAPGGRRSALVESGPAGGVAGAVRVGEPLGEPDILYLDVGGTTAKCSLIRGRRAGDDDRLQARMDAAPAGLSGEGAGRRHRRDRRRRRHRSRGSTTPARSTSDRRARAPIPGPACYGGRRRSRPSPTPSCVTGVIDAEYFVGGRLRVDRALARDGDRPPSRRLGSRRAETRQRRHPPRQRQHDQCAASSSPSGAATTRATSCSSPAAAAARCTRRRSARAAASSASSSRRCRAFSAWGMLRHRAAARSLRTRSSRTSETRPRELDGASSPSSRPRPRRASARRARRRRARTRTIEMRYAGQEHTVERAARRGAPTDSRTSRPRFHAEHEQAYTFALADTPIEIVTFHLATHRRATKPRAPLRGREALPRRAQGSEARRLRRRRHPRHTGARARRPPERVRSRRASRDRGGDDDRARASGPDLSRSTATATSSSRSPRTRPEGG